MGLPPGGPVVKNPPSNAGDAGLITGQETKGLCGGSNRKESSCNAGNPGSIPGLRRSSGEGNGSPLQYSCLENSTDKGAWKATVHGVAKSPTHLSNSHTHTHTNRKLRFYTLQSN